VPIVIELLTGVTFLFSAMFAGSGVLKLAQRAEFELVLVQLFGTRLFARAGVSSRIAATGVAAYELLLAALLASRLFLPIAPVLLLATMAVFLLVVGRSLRLHVACGCFRSRRPAEVSTLVRALLLLALAALLVFGRIPAVRTLHQAALGAGWAAGLALGLYLTVVAVRALMRIQYRAAEVPWSIPMTTARDILTVCGRPVPDVPTGADGCVRATALCRASRLPVSTLFLELERQFRGQSASPTAAP
jgi:hypothetical protein